MREQPAGLLAPRPVAAERLRAEVAPALAAIEALRARVPDLPGWANLPLFNQSGELEDCALRAYEGQAQPTSLCDDLPACAELVRWVEGEGLSVEVARIAVLAPGAQLRAHVDEYERLRLIVSLNADPAFRHVFGEHCVALESGEPWAVDGHVCHGAMNLHASRERVALLIDARPEASSLPPWYEAAWEIPPERRLGRIAWSERAQESRRAAAAALAAEVPVSPELAPAEALWLSTPYTHAIDHATAYASLVDFCETLAHERGEPGWSERAAFWEARSCRCVPLEVGEASGA